MNKQLLTGIILCLLTTPFFAQGKHHSDKEVKPNYELAERFSTTRIQKMIFSTSVKANWFKNSNRFWYEYRTHEGTRWMVVDPVKKTKTELFDNAQLAAKITMVTKDPCDAQHLPIRNLELKDDKTFTFEVVGTEMAEKKKEEEKKGEEKAAADPQRRRGPRRGGNGNDNPHRIFYFEYDLATRTITHLEDKEADKKYPGWGNVSPNKEWVVFSRNNNLFYMSFADYEKARENEKDSTIVEHQLTTDGTSDFSYGFSIDTDADSTEIKARNNVWGLMWSPDSKHFALRRYNSEGVKPLWVINALSEPRPTLEKYSYEMPGEENIAQSVITLFDMETKTGSNIKAEAWKDQSLSLTYKPSLHRDSYNEIRFSEWLGDNNGFYFYRCSRDLHRIDVCRANVEDGTVTPLIEERLNTYIEIKSLYTSGNGSELIHWSERSGWGHLYLYNADGTLKNAITEGPWHVDEILGVDEKTRSVFFTACGREKGEDPYLLHIYRANLDGSDVRLLTKGEYQFTADLSDDNRYFVSTYSRIDVAPTSKLFDANGREVMKLEDTDLTYLVDAGYKFPERFIVKAADGITDLYGMITKPYDFDPEKKYPIITYVYPGPQVEGPYQEWGPTRTRIDRLAQIGFIVISVGNRGGHPNRSKWYHNFGYGNLRDYGLADQKYAIEQLAARYNFIDIDRVGIIGHSGGGFMSTAAILTYPDFFKVAVSCAGNHENNIYNRWWSETHHGVKEVVTNGDTTFQYNINKNTELAKNLKGHLLLVHGDIDNNVHPANTIRMANALIRANKRFDMLILPGQRHDFGNMTEYFFWKMADYFSKWLLGESEESVDIPQLNRNY